MDNKITPEGHLRAFCEKLSDLTLFPYQVAFLISCLLKKRVVGIFGRQMGKTTIIGLFAIYMAYTNPNYNILIVAPTDRQAGELFSRLRTLAMAKLSKLVKYSTQREIMFKNGSIIKAMPTGDSGDTIRGQTADLIILEESSYIKSSIVNQVIMPMISSKGEEGRLIQIGTPYHKNHFYRASVSNFYDVHQYDYTHTPLISDKFIEEQREELTTLEFAMEYEAKFIDDTDSYFNYDLVMSCVDPGYNDPEVHPKSSFYLGVDFARLGQDKSVFVVLEKKWDRPGIFTKEIQETKNTALTASIGKVKQLHQKYNFQRIYLDETGIGAGPSDVLREELGYIVEPVTFTVTSKQDIFSNLRVLLEKGELVLPDNKRLISELLDLKYEISASGNMKIHHSERGHDDYPDALALACIPFKPKINIQTYDCIDL